MGQLVPLYAPGKAIAIFSCNANYANMCKVAVDNLEAMGIGHLAVASDEDVCDTLVGLYKLISVDP
jgi:hypothetical protein